MFKKWNKKFPNTDTRWLAIISFDDDDHFGSPKKKKKKNWISLTKKPEIIWLMFT